MNFHVQALVRNCRVQETHFPVPRQKPSHTQDNQSTSSWITAPNHPNKKQMLLSRNKFGCYLPTPVPPVRVSMSKSCTFILPRFHSSSFLFPPGQQPPQSGDDHHPVDGDTNPSTQRSLAAGQDNDAGDVLDSTATVSSASFLPTTTETSSSSSSSGGSTMAPSVPAPQHQHQSQPQPQQQQQKHRTINSMNLNPTTPAMVVKPVDEHRKLLKSTGPILNYVFDSHPPYYKSNYYNNRWAYFFFSGPKRSFSSVVCFSCVNCSKKRRLNWKRYVETKFILNLCKST